MFCALVILLLWFTLFVTGICIFILGEQTAGLSFSVGLCQKNVLKLFFAIVWLCDHKGGFMIDNSVHCALFMVLKKLMKIKRRCWYRYLLFPYISRSCSSRIDIGKFSQLSNLKCLQMRAACSGLKLPTFAFSGGMSSLKSLTCLKKLVSTGFLLSMTTSRRPFLFQKN